MLSSGRRGDGLSPRTGSLSTASTGPIVDVHLPAFDTTWAADVGSVDSAWYPKDFPYPRTSDSLRLQTIAALREAGIVRAVTSGTDPRVVARYRAEDTARIIPAAMFGVGMNVDSLRAAHTRGDIRALGEVLWQYNGLSSTDPRVDAVWTLAEERDIPIGVHMGIAPPGWPERTPYRTRLGDPLALEDVLTRHPKVRVWVMHAGWPLLDQMLGLLYSSPSVYVDVAVINWYIPTAEFHGYLRRLVEAGFGNRIMYGSDQMIWPASIPKGIRAITDAPFLTESQKRDILCDNAQRFFRLDAGVCRTH